MELANQNRSLELQNLEKEIYESCDTVIKVGALMIDNHGNVKKIVGISKSEDGKFFVQYEDPHYNGSIRSESIDSILRSYTLFYGTKEELQTQSLELIHQDLTVVEDKKNSTDLMCFDKSLFLEEKIKLDTERQIILSKKRYLENFINQKLSALRNMADTMMHQIKRLQNVIWTIELYLGINEQIEKLQEGPEAKLDEPIHIVQEMIFLDEEVGDPTNGGYDIKNLRQFYDWLFLTSDYYKVQNFKLILPFEKCIVSMKIRRNDKQYSSNHFENSILNEANKLTLLLIRNGDSVYSIETDKRFSENLFPKESEISDMIADMNSGKPFRSRKEDVENIMDMYKRNFVIFQGLIDRTKIFGDLDTSEYQLMNNSAMNAGNVKLIYNNRLKLSDGSVNILDLLEKSQEELQKGDRIVWISVHRSHDDPDYRFFKLPYGYNKPRYPESGLYNVLEDTMEKPSWYQNQDPDIVKFFKYLPTDEVMYTDRKTGEFINRERKVPVSFRIQKYGDTYINFDYFSYKDINWLWKMLHDRSIRREYLSYMKILKLLIDLKNKEFEEEKPFANLIMSQTNCDYETAMDQIFWWKTKNQYKRSLKVDDQKALRMIIKNINQL
jgi:hypothetical protein